MMDVDFKNRTVLKIIVECELSELLSEDDPKAYSIMIGVFNGEESNNCDGSIYGYSNMMHIIASKAVKDTEGNIGLWECVTNSYKREEGYTMDYTFQHRFRSKSINYFFQKELFFSLVTCFIGLAIYLDFI